MTAPRRLFLASFLLLFLELAVIRWTSANVLYLAYFQNVVLLAAFLGTGIGLLSARRPIDLFPWLPVSLLAVIAAAFTLKLQVQISSSEVIYFQSTRWTRSVPEWAAFPAIFAVATTPFVAVGFAMSRPFAELPALAAYRVNLLGSLSGVVLFALFAAVRAPPLAWFLVVFLVYLLVVRERPPKRSVLIVQLPAAVAALVLVSLDLADGTVWSPYQRIHVEDGNRLFVNGIGHQTFEPLEQKLKAEPFYRVPFALTRGRPLDDVLVIGAGSGTDVATALLYGARHVDAVDIDPAILEIGFARNPDHVYDDPRVSAYVDDGRAFLGRTAKKYDLIVFALTDSVTLLSGSASIRLESFLFTRESFASARDHLKPGGIFAIYNFYRDAWLVDRFAGMLEGTFGHRPCARVSPGNAHLAVLAVENGPADLPCAERTLPAKVEEPATDDWPFPYLRGPSVPRLYLRSLLFIGVISLLGIALVTPKGALRSPQLDFFFLGAAFLLLETKAIAQFSLLFGSTWIVNAAVFAGVLVLAFLAARAAEAKLRVPLPLLGAVLGAALLVQYRFPLDALIGLPDGARYALGVLINLSPIFCSGLLFSGLLRDRGVTVEAISYNLLGTMLGGCLEYLAMLLGYRNLTVVVALLYATALGLALSRREVTAPSAR